jgi:hypothetical protein
MPGLEEWSADNFGSRTTTNSTTTTHNPDTTDFTTDQAATNECAAKIAQL